MFDNNNGTYFKLDENKNFKKFIFNVKVINVFSTSFADYLKNISFQNEKMVIKGLSKLFIINGYSLNNIVFNNVLNIFFKKHDIRGLTKAIYTEQIILSLKSEIQKIFNYDNEKNYKHVLYKFYRIKNGYTDEITKENTQKRTTNAVAAKKDKYNKKMKETKEQIKTSIKKYNKNKLKATYNNFQFKNNNINISSIMKFFNDIGLKLTVKTIMLYLDLILSLIKNVKNNTLTFIEAKFVFNTILFPIQTQKIKVIQLNT